MNTCDPCVCLACVTNWETKHTNEFTFISDPLVAQRLKHLPAMWEAWVWSLGWEDPLEKEMATHSSILAWRIPWTEEPGRLQSIGSQSRTQLSDFTFFILWKRRKWQPTPVFLPGKSHGWRSLVGYSPWGHKGSDTTDRLHFPYLVKTVQTQQIKHVLFPQQPPPHCSLWLKLNKDSEAPR